MSAMFLYRFSFSDHQGRCGPVCSRTEIGKRYVTSLLAFGNIRHEWPANLPNAGAKSVQGAQR